MTAEAQRIAIAEACGWERWKSQAGNVVLTSPATERQREYWLSCHCKRTADNLTLPLKIDGLVPEFTESLDAMHEAEKVLTPEQEETYVSRLAEAIMETAYEDAPRYLNSRLSSEDSTYRATAAQRAEAFLRTLNLWTK